MSAIAEPAPTPTPTPAAPANSARARKGWDIWLTIGLILVTIIAWFAGAGISYLGLAFFGSCNQNGCSGDSLITGGEVLIVVGILGILGSIVMLIIRRRGWPVALITLGIVLLGWIVANVVDFR